MGFLVIAIVLLLLGWHPEDTHVSTSGVATEP